MTLDVALPLLRLAVGNSLRDYSQLMTLYIGGHLLCVLLLAEHTQAFLDGEDRYIEVAERLPSGRYVTVVDGHILASAAKAVERRTLRKASVHPAPVWGSARSGSTRGVQHA